MPLTACGGAITAAAGGITLDMVIFPRFILTGELGGLGVA